MLAGFRSAFSELHAKSLGATIFEKLIPPPQVKAEVDVAEDDEIRLVCSEASGFTRTGKPSVVKVGRALFTSEGGLTLGFDGTPPPE